MINRILGSVAGAAIMWSAMTGAATAEGDSPIGRFEIARFEVHGNTLLSAAAIDRLLASYTGKDRDFGSVEMAVEALENAYRAKGYSVVQVVLPEQELDRGIVQLTVIETRIGKISVTGNRHFSESNIRDAAPSLVPGDVPNVDDVSGNLKLANENPAKKTVLQLQSADEDGRIDAVLSVTDQAPWTIGASIDNTGDTQTGRNHLTLQYENADIGGWDHVLSLQYTTSLQNPSQVAVYGMGYHIPLYELGDSLDFYGSYSDVDAGTVSVGLLNLAVSGKGAVAGARYNHNMPRIGDYDSKLIAGFDYKAFENSISLAGLPLGNDVTVHPFSVTYTGTLPVAEGTANFYLSGLRNIPGGANGGGADFALARSGATASYTILRYGVSYMRALPADWQVRLMLNGQITSDALVSGEQFGAGGAASVRGFDEREFANDRGRTINLELYTPSLCGDLADCRFVGFYDTGYLSRNHALAGEETQEAIDSTGVGLRLNIGGCQAQVDYAYVVNGLDTTPNGSSRVHFKALFTY